MRGQLVDQRERLVQAERVAAWRELARRLAHELKNPLFPLRITIDNLRRGENAPPRGDDADFRARAEESALSVEDHDRQLAAGEIAAARRIRRSLRRKPDDPADRTWQPEYRCRAVQRLCENAGAGVCTRVGERESRT